METLPFKELRQLYNDYFSLSNINTDINKKFALISLTCKLVYEFRKKKPDVTYYQVLRKIDEGIPEEFIKTLAIICEDFGYNCKEFPTFGIEMKNIPKTIKGILNEWLPF